MTRCRCGFNDTMSSGLSSGLSVIRFLSLTHVITYTKANSTLRAIANRYLQQQWKTLNPQHLLMTPMQNM